MFGKCKMRTPKKLKEYKHKEILFKNTVTIEFRDGSNKKVVFTDYKFESKRRISLAPSYLYGNKNVYETVEVDEVQVNRICPTYLNNTILSTIFGDTTNISFMMSDVKLVITDKEKIGEVETIRYEAV